MSLEQICAVVAGGLGTDIFGLELERLVGPGELEFGGRLHIGAGGKSRNIAQMLAVLLGESRVAMVGRTSRDPLGLWRVPVEALEQAGVNVRFVKIMPFEAGGKFPQVALIAVDRQGNNQIYVLPGINEDFSAGDIEEAVPAFQAATANGGLLVLSLELPTATAVAAIRQANACGLKVAFDPGGIQTGISYDKLLAHDIYLIKPNEHEAEILTGIKVTGEDTARQAARCFLERGIRNVLITMGADGACLLGENLDLHIPAPRLALGQARDETGCGDQTMAALCASLLQGDDLATAAGAAVLAGTLQFHRAGIVPVTRAELAAAAGQSPTRI